MAKSLGSAHPPGHSNVAYRHFQCRPHPSRSPAKTPNDDRSTAADLREGPPDNHPSRPEQKFIFSILFAEMEGRVMKL